MTCPICSKRSEAKFTPFCSRRCADVDLSRWLKGSYAIPGGQAGDEDADKPSLDPDSPENRGLDRPNRGMDRE
jgi:endogenous inhibitor of DNA gyrase (YacG/DUF329 family)